MNIDYYQTQDFRGSYTDYQLAPSPAYNMRPFVDYNNNMVICLEIDDVWTDRFDNDVGSWYLNNRCFDYRQTGVPIKRIANFWTYLGSVNGISNWAPPVLDETIVYLDDHNTNLTYNIPSTLSGSFKCVFQEPNRILVSWLKNTKIRSIYSTYSSYDLKLIVMEFDGYVDKTQSWGKKLSNLRIVDRYENFILDDSTGNSIPAPEFLFSGSPSVRLLGNGNALWSTNVTANTGYSAGTTQAPFDKIIIFNQSLDIIKTFSISDYIPYVPLVNVAFDALYFMNKNSFSIMVHWYTNQHNYQSLLFDNNGDLINIEPKISGAELLPVTGANIVSKVPTNPYGDAGFRKFFKYNNKLYVQTFLRYSNFTEYHYYKVNEVEVVDGRPKYGKEVLNNSNIYISNSTTDPESFPMSQSTWDYIYWAELVPNPTAPGSIPNSPYGAPYSLYSSTQNNNFSLDYYNYYQFRRGYTKNNGDGGWNLGRIPG